MFRLSVSLLLLAGLASGQTLSQREQWNLPFEPFRIIGNIYFVGAAGVSAFLIKGEQGSILLDGGLPETGPVIARNVAKLGFEMTSVKVLLNSHAHYDHSGGLAELHRLSDAKIVASQEDRAALEAGIDSFGTFPKVHVDRVIGDGETVQVSGNTMTAHVTPGHTKGCTTWTTDAVEAGKTYHVVFSCSVSVVEPLAGNTKYPNIVADYERTFARLKAMPCDVFLAPHGGQFDLEAKRKKQLAGDPLAFVDPGAWKRYLEESEAAYREKLAAAKRK